MQYTEKITAKKSLGQNFLKSKVALSAMISASDIKNGDTILEIGPGQGALTEKLLQTGAKIVAVEKDQRLIKILEDKFGDKISQNQLTLIYGDILDINLKKLDFFQFF